MEIIQIIINFIRNLLVPKSRFGTHVIPPVFTGSPDWQTPPINNVSQNWFPYFSLPYTSQVSTSGFYEDNCAVRAAIETIEAILNYYLVNTLFPEPVDMFLRKYYCNTKGMVKLSVRYHSKLCNVQLGIGTTMDTVLNGFAQWGLVPENIYPDPVGKYTWNEYMAPIPKGIENYGAYSTTFFQILWNVVCNGNWEVPNPDTLRKALMLSPIYWGGKIGNVINGIEQWQGIKMYEHCRVIGSVDNFINVLDNYELNGSEIRKLSMNFPIPTAINLQVKII